RRAGAAVIHGAACAAVMPTVASIQRAASPMAARLGMPGVIDRIRGANIPGTGIVDPLWMIERLVNGRRHYAWLIVGVTFVTLITTAGFRATPGVLIVPLQNHFGWSRGTISLAVSLGLLMYGLAAPFSAALMD